MKRAKKFIQHLKSSPELQSRLSSASWSIDSVVDAGAKAGFNFTGEEYGAAYQELAREELSAVVGGASAAWKAKSKSVDTLFSRPPDFISLSLPTNLASAGISKL